MDTRTHDNTSAIDDDFVDHEGPSFTGPIGGTLNTPLERGEGADAPQSELSEGGMPLLYTEQNFNELVAANSALISELAGRDAALALREEYIVDLRDRLKDTQARLEKAEAAYDKASKEIKAANVALEDHAERNAWLRECIATADKRTERAKGYIDRVLDDEVRLSPQVSETRPAPRDPIGPDLSGIHNPPPPSRQNGHRDIGLFAPSELREFNPHETRRRY
jgi:hypothetical protein